MLDGDAYNPVRARYEIRARLGLEADDIPTREYVAQIMARLRDLELLDRVPPDNSGLYRITDLGRAAFAIVVDEGTVEFGFRELVSRAEAGDVSVEIEDSEVVEAVAEAIANTGD